MEDVRRKRSTVRSVYEDSKMYRSTAPNTESEEL